MGSFHVVLLTFTLYIQWYQFIIFQVTLTTPSHQVLSSYMLVFKILHLNLLIVVIFYPQVGSWISPYQTQNNIDYLQIKIFKVKHQRNRNILVSTVCALSKQNLPRFIHQRCGCVSISSLKPIARKGLMEGLPTNLPELELLFTIFLLNKATKITRGPTIYVSKFAPRFMLQMDFSFFKCWNNPWIYPKFCGYMFFHFIPLWTSIQKHKPTAEM